MYKAFLTLFTCLTISISGCGGGNSAGLLSISGQITLDGQALPDATVTFISDSGQISAGKTDEQGKYKLVSGTGETGAAPGQYRVEISASQAVEGKVDSEGEKILEQVVPDKYNQKTTLTADLSAPRDDLDFSLESK